VEDWTIQNQAEENHEFHMHQIHFLLLAVNGVPVKPDQQQLYDGTSIYMRSCASFHGRKLQGSRSGSSTISFRTGSRPPMTRRVTHGSTPTRRFST
jgi:FtsP/CotA-like multicopper oxidase with cupredoxin domain